MHGFREFAESCRAGLVLRRTGCSPGTSETVGRCQRLADFRPWRRVWLPHGPCNLILRAAPCGASSGMDHRPACRNGVYGQLAASVVPIDGGDAARGRDCPARSLRARNRTIRRYRERGWVASSRFLRPRGAPAGKRRRGDGHRRRCARAARPLNGGRICQRRGGGKPSVHGLCVTTPSRSLGPR